MMFNNIYKYITQRCDKKIVRSVNSLHDILGSTRMQYLRITLLALFAEKPLLHIDR